MNDRQESNRDRLLEQATDSLRDCPIPDGPTADVLAETVQALQDASRTPIDSTFKERRLAMQSFSKIAAIAAGLVIFAGTVIWLLISGGGASVALADVASVLDKVRGVTYTMTVTKEGEPPVTIKAMYLDPTRHRAESSRGIVMIFGESKMITLVAKNKAAFVFDLENAPDDDTAKNWLEEVRQQIRLAVSEDQPAIENLGKRQVDGRDAIGFRLSVNNSDMTIWADPRTALPIRIESEVGVMEPKYHHVMSDFVYDAELDESLFSLNPPEGYLVQETTIDSSVPLERDFVEVLRIHATEHEAGLFPASLATSEIEKGVTYGIQERIDEKFGNWRADIESRKRVLASPEFQEFMETGKKLGRGIGFLGSISLTTAWHYAGKDVRIGTLERPIFWYLPNNSDKYRVIYADLTVKEIAKDDLTDFPEAVTRN